jgi:CRISPR-associated protein Cmr6
MGKQQTLKSFDSLGKHLGMEFTNEKNRATQEDVVPYPNLGWLFYKNYYAELEKIKDEVDFLENKDDKVVENFFSQKNKNIIMSPVILPKNNQIKGMIGFKLKTTYPGLITGVGLNHQTGLMGEIKLGFQFDYTTGLPYIPGSSVKGLLRSAFPYSLKVKKEKEQEQSTRNYRYNRYVYIKGLLKALKDEKDGDISVELTDGEIRALEYAIFAGTDERGKAMNHPLRDLFLDAVIAKVSGKGLIGTDFITPHKDPLKDPKPIQFFKILPETVFKFDFKLHKTILFKEKAYTETGFEKLKEKSSEKEDFDRTVFENIKEITPEMKKNIFRQILLDFGVGAKTNVGYGQFTTG